MLSHWGGNERCPCLVVVPFQREREAGRENAWQRAGHGLKNGMNKRKNIYKIMCMCAWQCPAAGKGFWQRRETCRDTGELRGGISSPQNPQDVPGQRFVSPGGVSVADSALLSTPVPPGRDPPVRRLQPAHPGQVHPQGPGPALAQLLPQVRRLPDAAGRALLLPGRQRLLQGGFLQVSNHPHKSSISPHAERPRSLVLSVISPKILLQHVVVGIKGVWALCSCCQVDAGCWD